MVNGKMVKCNFLQEMLKIFNCFMPCQAVFCFFSRAQRCPAIRAGPSRREAKWGRSQNLLSFLKKFLTIKKFVVFLHRLFGAADQM